jgi:hypothetical protein
MLVPCAAAPPNIHGGSAAQAGLPEGGGLERRKFLTGIGLLAGGLVLTPRVSAGLTAFDGLPQRWCASQGTLLVSYAEFLQGLRLTRISIPQILKAHAKCRGGIWNHLPPRSLWRNIGPTLKAVDLVAAELGQSVLEVVSVYRSPRYNAKCPGAARGSYHMRNNAIDVRFGAGTNTVAAAATRLRARGKFHGGVGHYPSFTHLDTRGVDATW